MPKTAAIEANWGLWAWSAAVSARRRPWVRRIRTIWRTAARRVGMVGPGRSFGGTVAVGWGVVGAVGVTLDWLT